MQHAERPEARAAGAAGKQGKVAPAHFRHRRAARHQGSPAPQRLRIWMVSQSYLPFYGGITEHVWHLTAQLARRGHEVHLITGRPLRARTTPGDADPPGVEVSRVGRTLRVPSHGARACVTIGPGGRRAGPLADSPDILHLQSPLEPFLPLAALHRLPGIKIGTFHTGGRHPHWGYRYLARWLAPAARRLDLRVAVSREAARFVGRHFPGDYRVIPNGVDLERFAGAPDGKDRRRPTPPDPLRVLSVGRLDPRKGLGPLLRAMGGLAADAARGKLPAVELTIVGDGPLRRRLSAAIARHRLPVTLAGAVPRERLARYYRAADLFVAPATDGESCGVALLEALAAGLPMVASDLPGYRETLGPHPAALLCSPGSARDLQAALAALLRDPERRHSLAAAARQRAHRFAWPQIAAEIEALYYEALRAAGPQRTPVAGGLPAAGQSFKRAIRSNPRRVSASSTS